MLKKRGQLTIFIILAILIVAIIALFFAFRGKIIAPKIPESIQPVENFLLSCLEEEVSTGVDILESQGGYIELPDFEAGSSFMPFGSQLNFLGNPIPYWFYISGNNLKKEQVPAKEDMESELENFIENQMQNCNFEDYYAQGYKISAGTPEAQASIRDKDVKVGLKMDLAVEFGGESAVISEHSKIISSNLGNLYGAAKAIYDEEQKSLFLEKYAVDNLRLYAPVDGVEFSCAPLIWNADEVFTGLSEAIETNTLALRNSGSEKDYFAVKNLPVSSDYEIRFINSRDWPRAFEVEPSDENFLIANPVGNQPELGILGFCYVPYHFVYDIKYPVLVQITKDDETFQFPTAVIVRGNNAREPLNATGIISGNIGLCENKNTNIKINVFDSKSNPVGAEIFYECFGEKCRIGDAISGKLESNFPQCANGFVVAKTEGFKQARETFSTINEGSSLSIYLDKEYELPVKLKLDGTDYGGEAIITFVPDSGASGSVVYPEQKTIKLSEGFYEFQVRIFRDSSLELGSFTKEQCIEIPIGIFELTREKCFDIEFPSQVVSKALAGGGTQEYYLLESELSNAKEMEINVDSLPVPDTIEKIQENNILFETKPVGIEFN